MVSENRTYELPVLPVKNAVVFPYIVIPYVTDLPRSIAAIDYALGREDTTLAIFAQRNPNLNNPGLEDLYAVGTSAIVRLFARSDSAVQVFLQGVERIEITDLFFKNAFLVARVRSIPMAREKNIEMEAMEREILDLAKRYFSLTHPDHEVKIPQMVPSGDFSQVIYPLGQLLNLPVERSQALLEAHSLRTAMRLMGDHLQHEVQILEVRKRISDRAQSKMTKNQREYILREQLEAIQKELGESVQADNDLADLKSKFDSCKLPESVYQEVKREFQRLQRIPAMSPEYQVARSHMELVFDMPWNTFTEDNLELNHARKILDEDHYGLKDIKERIIEQLAVMKLNPGAKSPILCFIGPPGVGKTSLGQSIARSLGRKFERFSLGGMSDEAELRGHRRTYIGAMPGRIVQALRRSGVRNPLVMLDEIDKLGRDFRGDPAAALMEILDPAQNSAFRDNYLDLPFDLSKVFFILTANTVDTIPKPLFDRMEVLQISGYGEEEKKQIAIRYLIPRQRAEAGLSDEQFHVADTALVDVIRSYTREAGVRELERTIGKLVRKVAIRFAEQLTEPVVIDNKDLPDMLGPERFFIEKLRKSLPPGVATGLAWTEAGGDVLYVEALNLPHKDNVTLTGHLGEVMKESAIAATSYLDSESRRLHFEIPKGAVHIHVPAGAIPKDGPSAGLTMAAALASLYSGLSTRSDTAMTGEITLSGLVLPVGGIKEKILAARRADIRRIVLPEGNQKDLQQLPDYVRNEMEFIFVGRIREALAAAIPGLVAE
ncbi:MAG: endopeptidase La [Desulfobacterales bacterium GWB2_56_26]|nr:MAG: endopeptidase La [Desulfobacterales bacterium GWB2_56_26]